MPCRPRRAALTEALVGADVFLGLSRGRRGQAATWSRAWRRSRSSSPWPIPTRKSRPPEAKAARPDAIVATGRSDYPNQVNNVLGFPFIFRGALDVRATGINEEMKIAAAHCAGRRWRARRCRRKSPRPMAAISHSFGPDYIIPAPFDPRLIEIVPCAVAQAAMDTGVAQKPIADMRAYRQQLRARLNPTASVLSLAYEAARSNPKRVLFAEGEEPNVLRAAIAFKDGGYGTPVLVGREDVYDKLAELGVDDPAELRSAQQPQFAAGRPRGRLYLRQAPAPRHAAPRGRADGQPGPQHLRRRHARAGRGRRDDHRHDAPVQPVAAPGPHG